jgi:hypothetical protein
MPTTPSDVWKPNSQAQVRFLSSPAYEALFGGAAGPGKSDCLLMEALRQIGNPAYRGILFRRIFPSLEGAGGLIDRSRRWYPYFGGRYNENNHCWTFPQGSKIYFGHMQYEKSMYIYQGHEFAFIGWDELTEFLEKQYLYMFTRNRAPLGSGLRVYVRAGTNPGQEGHEWVKRRFITRGIVDRIRYFATQKDPYSGKETDYEVPKNHADGRSRAFYPAKWDDNPMLDPEYIKTLRNDPDPVRRAQLLNADWDIQYTEGLVYQEWGFENIDGDLAYDPSKPIIWGVDDGYAEGHGKGTESYHPRVILMCQVNSLGGLNVLDEYVAAGVSDYDESIDTALVLGTAHNWGNSTPSMVQIDSSAAMFKGALWKRGIGTVGATHAVVEGIRNLRRMIKDAQGVRLLKVHPRCQYLIYEMGTYRNDPNRRGEKGELIPMKLNDHCLDALRYVAWHLRYE